MKHRQRMKIANEARRLHEQDQMTPAEIAAYFGLHRLTIYKYIRLAGGQVLRGPYRPPAQGQTPSAEFSPEPNPLPQIQQGMQVGVFFNGKLQKVSTTRAELVKLNAFITAWIAWMEAEEEFAKSKATEP